MKCYGILLYLACIFSVALGSKTSKLDKAYSKIMSHAQEIIKNTRTTTGTDSSACYEKLVNNTEAIVSTFKEMGNKCELIAIAERDSNIAATDFLKEHAEIEFLIGNITKYFNDCSEQNYTLFYNCFAAKADYSINNMNKIKEISTNVLSLNFEQSNKIDYDERMCLSQAVDFYHKEIEKNTETFDNCVWK